MSNLTLDHIKTFAPSIIASATRYKPNLSVTDPDDPRFVVGAEDMADKVAKAQTTAGTAKSAAVAAHTAANNAKIAAATAQTTADSAKTTADSAKTTADEASTFLQDLAWDVYDIDYTVTDLYIEQDRINNESLILWRPKQGNVQNLNNATCAYADGMWVMKNTKPPKVGTWMYYSADGITWTEGDSFVDNAETLVHAGEYWFVVGQSVPRFQKMV